MHFPIQNMKKLKEYLLAMEKCDQTFGTWTELKS